MSWVLFVAADKAELLVPFPLYDSCHVNHQTEVMNSLEQFVTQYWVMEIGDVLEVMRVCCVPMTVQQIKHGLLKYIT